MSKFILFWDCYGLESCIDITEDVKLGNKCEHENLFERIKHPEKEPENPHVKKLSNTIQSLELRSRFNPQRNYELYMIDTVDGITKDDIVRWFTDTPQAAADRCRLVGTKLMSNRDTAPDRRVIV